jgi:hypothetical protein
MVSSSTGFLAKQSGTLAAFKVLVPGTTLVSQIESISKSELKVSFGISLSDQRLVWPHPNARAGRRDELWKTTCFEIFLGSSQALSYIEINLSPSGDWAVYQFADIRTGMSRIESAKVEISTKMTEWERSLSAHILVPELSDIIKAEYHVGATAVLDWEAQIQEYWALQHSAVKPDFHQRKDWVWRKK